MANRAQLAGGERNKVSLKLETRLSEWIHWYSIGDKHKGVSRKNYKNYALEI